jgi:hypothetical protein
MLHRFSLAYVASLLSIALLEVGFTKLSENVHTVGIGSGGVGVT